MQRARSLQQPGIAFAEHFEQGVHLLKKDAGETRIVACDVFAVVDQVGELDRLGARRRERHVPTVDLLACRTIAVAGTADIGQVPDQCRDRGAELPLHVFERGRRVLHHVVQPGGGDHLSVLGRRGNQACHGFQVNVVGLIAVLAALVDALVRTRRKFPGAIDQFGHLVSSGRSARADCPSSGRMFARGAPAAATADLHAGTDARHHRPTAPALTP